ncbi:Predicted DNA-binding protein, MmcQ/YjbR family [Catalinimonas alkaloidigena]|uniref:Predicted DNA-binding protein, MmcQ/YjbR family n=1 Tax=Catalinimonas alkaloidigena TaxID=1075417 RepID=A0A1G9DFB2_9BACT|nr:MmcQ/YjbR family DNA-binding protein [Catalinimonas alkaloidigena]SDK62494.1 Predicted DNA-binding protein, MmcQ/YjbR family [Catalinimonas alkaloidigena]
MHIEEYREYCLSFPGVTEELPFGEETLVFKVKGKIFALSGIEEFGSINVKCDPEKAVELREKYRGVVPGYHMNKRHWNTLLLREDLADRDIRQWIRDSYELVVSGLPRQVREALAAGN